VRLQALEREPAGGLVRQAYGIKKSCFLEDSPHVRWSETLESRRWPGFDTIGVSV
jgi:hypothetical protein